MDFNQASLDLHKKHQGKIALHSKVALETREDLSVAYTPGVAEVCKAIAKDKSVMNTYTSRGNWVAVVTDGSAVLGLGNIGPQAAMPVMEGKAILFKEFGGVDAFPICLNTQDPEEIIRAVKAISLSFGGINLEDISAPLCFDIEERLKAELDIPVFHDDQHGTAIVVLAGLINSAKLLNKPLAEMKVVINGVGAAGMAVAKILIAQGVKDLLLVDSTGIISPDRTDLNSYKQKMLAVTNKQGVKGDLAKAVQGRDVFIGVSKAGLLTPEMVRTMAKDPVIFALANPVPEIMPEEAKKAGAKIVATGRSDFSNQVNNVLAFPGVFRGAFDASAKQITEKMKLAAAFALAKAVKNPSVDCIIPNPLDKSIAPLVAKAVADAV